MPQHAEVVVVGAGMFGSAAAKYLSRGGADVVVVGPGEPDRYDAARLPEFGAYYDESRIARRLGWDRVWGTLDTRSAARYRDIEAESGIGFFRECGSLALVAKSMRCRTDAMLRASEEDGVAVRRSSGADVRAQFPGLEPPPLAGGTEGLLEREDAGCLNPRRMVRAQLDLAVASGARLVRGSVAAVCKADGAAPWDVLVEGAEKLRISAERVLIATGSLINHSRALPSGCSLDLQVFTEPNLLFEVDDSQRARYQDLPTVVTIDPEDSGSDNNSAYLIPPVRYPDGGWYVRIGPAMQPVVHELRTGTDVRAWYARERITPEQARFLTRMARLLIPDLRPTSVRDARCVVDKTPSRYPYIGPLDGMEGLTVAVGGNGHGARGSDEIGRLASAVVLGRPWDFPVPREVFVPRLAAGMPQNHEGRPAFLQPPFGLC